MAERQTKCPVRAFSFCLGIETCCHQYHVAACSKLFGVTTNKLTSLHDSHPKSRSSSVPASCLLQDDLVRPGLEAKRAIVSERGKCGPVIKHEFVINVESIRASEFPVRLHKDVIRA